MRTGFPTTTLRRTRGLLIAVALLGVSMAGGAQTFVSVSIAPPALPVYVQPAIPGPGYIWTPGYWAYGPAGYYWVPGTWALPPAVGLLWTPGYWGWRNGAYAWHGGYWGPRVGYYGGINYGFGYVGTGYAGGYWNNGAFYYNRAVNNVNVNSVHNTYNTTVNNTTINRVSYNGGTGGVRAEPTVAEREAMNERHVEATQLQQQHENAAASNRALLASENHGRPAIAATPQPGAFDHPGAVAARGNPAHNQAQVQGNAQAANRQSARMQSDAQVARSQGAHVQGNAQAAHPQGATVQGNAQVARPQGAHGQGNAQAAHPLGANVQGNAQVAHPQAHAQGAGPAHAAQAPHNAGEPRGEGQRH